MRVLALRGEDELVLFPTFGYMEKRRASRTSGFGVGLSDRKKNTAVSRSYGRPKPVARWCGVLAGGRPEEGFSVLADLWSPCIGKPISEV